ncbi:fumarylacetoacetate hydrolase family protein [Kibdelosporangium aridum]|uniref:Fumarylacetoacetate hydrolase family protein n=1 Tax=Kibdelosporangium aridum TaxID=2030 RepID=A0A428YPQ3_KIBAR|nr:fumarylacetoacetate hydrolase family protein [Kibdelosporangium aridum]
MARGEGDELLVLDLPHPDVKALLEDDIELARTAPVIDRLPLADAQLLAPVPMPGQIVIAGANYRDHVIEAGMPVPDRALFTLVPAEFVVDGLVVGPDAPLVLPAEAPDQIDYEAELAVVIGKPGKDISVADAWSHVGGLIVVNDVSARDVQLKGFTNGIITDQDQVRKGKIFPSCKTTGPAVVTVDELALPLDLAITTRVNGELRQDSRTSQMLFPIPEVLQTVSAEVALETGDIVLTGTPSGVAVATGKYLRAGDIVEIEVEGLGAIRSEVVRQR